MKSTALGYLCFNNEFYYKGEKYAAMDFKLNKMKVECVNLKSRKVIYLDCDDIVEVEE